MTPTDLGKRTRKPRVDRTEAAPAERPADSGGPRVPYIDHPSFAQPETAEALWGAHADPIDVEPYSLLPEVEGDGEVVARRTALSRTQEQTLFLRYNYAKYRLNQLAGRRQTPSLLDEESLWRRRAAAVREKIIHANLPLVPAVAKRKRVEGVDMADKISEGYLAVLRSVEYFDVSRGFKFSTYACRAILAALFRLGTKTQTYRKHVPAQYDMSFEPDDSGRRREHEQRTDVKESVRRVLRTNDAGLNDVQREVIRRRFPLDDGARPQPRWKIGRHLGVSTEQVRRIERMSLDRLGQALDVTLSA
ncbi:MAG: sigma-70 family RNA polymerase sigma factor [Planctomycetes bacterium]|nr:sigma-70 family RNA polymerase sigma factor [Planctomycetota bacterium]